MVIGKHLGKYKSIIATASMISEITETIDDDSWSYIIDTIPKYMVRLFQQYNIRL
jgi:hypothetical protein